MSIRKLSKNISKTKKRLSKSRLSKSRLSKSRLSKNKRRLSKKNKIKNKNKNKKYQRGGFFGSSNCSIASVNESGFNLSPLSAGATKITGFSIAPQKAIIFDPQCPAAPSQAGVF